MLRNERDLKTLLGLDFDPEVVGARNRHEREKRLKVNGDRQYLKASGNLESFMEEHSTKAPPIVREAEDAEVDVVLLGGGFASLRIAARLHQAGIENYRIIDRTSDFGGAWYWNRYPGCNNDTESYIYLPFLEETGYIPEYRYIHADEIQQHAVRVARHFEIDRHALFQTEVTRALWNDEQQRWIVETDRGDVLRARYFVVGGGEAWSRPKMPGIPGMTDFKGRSFHSSRWDYDYTGGSCRGGLDRLKDKRVAIIGTGCTAIQIIPHLAESAKQLFVFQRTPTMVMPRNNFPTDPAFIASLEPGWQERRAANFNGLLEGSQTAEPMSDSGFADQLIQIREAGEKIARAAAEQRIDLSHLELLELTHMEFMEQVRRYIDSVVDEPKTADALKPWFATGWCKRPTWSDTYLQAFNQPNVTLVDIPLGVDRITEKGLVADGVEYEVDLIVYASGFELSSSGLFRLVQFPLVGRDGVTLYDYWSDDYHTLHGMLVHHFPNYFQLTQIGNGLGANYLYGNGKQADHVAWMIDHCMKQGIDVFEPTRDSEVEWKEVLRESRDVSGNARLAAIAQLRDQCTPGHYNSEGNLDDSKNLTKFVHGMLSGYLQLLEEWREADMPGLVLTRGDERIETQLYRPRHGQGPAAVGVDAFNQ